MPALPQERRSTLPLEEQGWGYAGFRVEGLGSRTSGMCIVYGPYESESGQNRVAACFSTVHMTNNPEE